ncbi:MAG TPA: sigma-70 family RNA polymerase sigma factor [Candidatus Gastranaerophilales bacterium]|nr:sigma-70 family RNA polymerase sigma factor [Candidatus Gastranaerophilales bacterium]
MNNSFKKEKEKENIDNIIKSYGHNIKNTIMLFTGTKNFQDIQQEVFIKIWKNLPKYQNNGKIHSWIKKITINTCKDHLKSKQFSQYTKTDFEEENLINIKDKKITPDELILLNERRKKIINAIETLKPKLREAITFYDIEEMTYEEISVKLKCPIGTVKSRLFAARKELQNKLIDLLN